MDWNVIGPDDLEEVGNLGDLPRRHVSYDKFMNESKARKRFKVRNSLDIGSGVCRAICADRGYRHPSEHDFALIAAQ
jgi:hypothetical protein